MGDAVGAGAGHAGVDEDGGGDAFEGAGALHDLAGDLVDVVGGGGGFLGGLGAGESGDGVGFGSGVGNNAGRAASTGRGAFSLLVVDGGVADDLALGIELFLGARDGVPIDVGGNAGDALAAAEDEGEHGLDFFGEIFFGVAFGGEKVVGLAGDGIVLAALGEERAVVVHDGDVVGGEALDGIGDEKTDGVDGGGERSPRPRSLTQIEAVGFFCLSTSRRFSGRVIMTRAPETPSSWLMVRASSPWTARRKLARCTKSEMPKLGLSKSSQPGPSPPGMPFIASCMRVL